MNDLATTDPELTSEWDYDRNMMISSEQVHRNSLRIVWWTCGRGHRWRAKIADRAIDKEPCHICRKEFDTQQYGSKIRREKGSPSGRAGTLGRTAAHRGRRAKAQGKRGTPVTTGETCGQESDSSCKQCGPQRSKQREAQEAVASQRDL